MGVAGSLAPARVIGPGRDSRERCGVYISMRLRSTVLAAAVLLLAGCSSAILADIELPATVTLGPGARIGIRGTSWTLAFDSVVSDSRCPIDVVCIQAGEAVLALALSDPLFDPEPGNPPQFTLGTTPVIKYGFKFTQLNVTPAPRSNVKINRNSYRATLKVETLTR